MQYATEKEICAHCGKVCNRRFSCCPNERMRRKRSNYPNSTTEVRKFLPPSTVTTRTARKKYATRKTAVRNVPTQYAPTKQRNCPECGRPTANYVRCARCWDKRNIEDC